MTSSSTSAAASFGPRFTGWSSLELCLFWLEINVIDLKERIAANKLLIARKKVVLPVKLRLLVCRLKSGFTVTYFLHKRNHRKLLLRKIRSMIYSLSYNDRILCETVSKVSRTDVLAFLNEAIQISDVPDVVKGEVLVDSRGRGSFQR
jgi:hypothetical protein